jgi:hypothetical protein
MKTDKLIDMLSTNLESVDHRRPTRMLAAALAIGAIAALGLMFVAFGVRHDLPDGNALLSLGLKTLFAGAVFALAVAALSKVMRPGGERKISLAAIWSPFIVITLLAIITLGLSPSSHWRTMLVGKQWLECLVSIPVIAVVPFALITWAIRQTAPTNLAWAGALTGLVAGGISALGYALHCTDDTVPFVALWYSATIALCTLAGAKLGPRLLRW